MRSTNGRAARSPDARRGAEPSGAWLGAQPPRVGHQAVEIGLIAAVVVAAHAQLAVDQDEAVAVGDGPGGRIATGEGDLEAVAQEGGHRVAVAGQKEPVRARL